jgi:hypothetical protein
MSSEEEKKEITVKAPAKPEMSAEKQSEKAAVKALEEERFSVLQFPKKISKYIGLLVISTGFLLFFLIFYVYLTGQTGVFLSTESSLFSLVLWGFVGLINIFVGFIFLGRE